MPGKEIKGTSKIATYRHGGRAGFSRGGGSAPWLRGRSGPSNIKAPRGSEGFKQMQQYDIKNREYPATKGKFSSKKKIKSGMRRFNRGGKV